jgi:nicotinate phosphoribosyltransferase
MKKPNPLEFTTDIAVAVADFYEYSMANANIIEGIAGKQTVFDLILRNAPINKVIGYFEHNGIKYEELEKRQFLVNAGLEQAVAYLLEGRGNKKLKNYMKDIKKIDNKTFLNWVKNISFEGDLYAMPEGTIFFAKEHQLRVHERFEEAQVFESLLVGTINHQTNIATTANDIASLTNKILLEGASRRAIPQESLFTSRAARIGGFHASSNVAFGMNYEEEAGGTHGHSYVMIHPEEYSAFKAQAKAFGDKVCFLLDTYNVKKALDIAMKIVKEENLDHFAFRIDSGDLLEQAKWIHDEMKKKGVKRSDYTLIASDDLTAAKIDKLEKGKADIDKYLVGTYVANPPRPVTAVYKLSAYKNNKEIVSDKMVEWINQAKISEDREKSTLPGIKQIYRISGSDGFYKKDIIAIEGESLEKYLEEGDSYKGLLIPIIKSGKQIYDFPTINNISKKRKEELAKFKNISNYEVIISDEVLAMQEKIISEHLNVA